MKNTLKSIINTITLKYLFIKLVLQTYKSIKNYNPDCAIGEYIEKPDYLPLSLALKCLLTKQEK